MSTWKPIPGWEGYYEASDTGLIRSVARTVLHRGHPRKIATRILRPGTNPKGYQIAVLARDGGRFAYPVHRLVGETFLGPLPEGMQTLHIDGDNSNNAVSNLRYGTPAENNRDITRHGRNVNAAKTHCPQGHGYTPDNLLGNGANGRKCRACHRQRNAARRARLRAAA